MAVNKDHTEFQTSKGEIIKTKDIIEEILTQTHLYVVGKQDNFLMVTKTDDGKKYLKAMPDDNLNNNLDSLKLIKEEK
ncbi:MAG: DUF3892 domain-containing protein [Mycoplasmataceae bacterium]|nr:DUF3892 domain-containing protein [Mycoplasmataceae bacterium]